MLAYPEWLTAPDWSGRMTFATCGARFLAARGVDMHRAASHPECFEEVAVRPKEYRHERADATPQ